MPKQNKPTLKGAVLAHCHECMGYYSDGIVDCENYKCPFYTWMIRGKKKKATLDWMNYNPKRVGHVTWEESERNISEEQREAASERLKKAREHAHSKDLADELDDELDLLSDDDGLFGDDEDELF